MNDEIRVFLLLMFIIWVPAFLMADAPTMTREFVRYECVALPHDGLGRPVFDCRVITRSIP